MNTPAHLIFGAAAFARPGAPWVTVAALAGALAPDLSLYLMAGWHLYALGTPPQVVFGQLYFSDSWMAVFRVDNSFILWGALLAGALWWRSKILIAFAGSALLHIALDFPLHHDDGRPHFWPLTDWVYQSPFSYWDRAHGASIIGPIETAACIGLCCLMAFRFKSWLARTVLALAVAAQLAPLVIWLFVFGT